MKEVIVDVRELEHPEPFMRIMAAVSALQSGEYIHMIHRREPLPLFDKLSGMNLAWQSRQTSEGRFDIYFWKADGPKPEGI